MEGKICHWMIIQEYAPFTLRVRRINTAIKFHLWIYQKHHIIRMLISEKISKGTCAVVCTEMFSKTENCLSWHWPSMGDHNSRAWSKGCVIRETVGWDTILQNDTRVNFYRLSFTEAFWNMLQTPWPFTLMSTVLGVLKCFKDAMWHHNGHLRITFNNACFSVFEESTLPP